MVALARTARRGAALLSPFATDVIEGLGATPKRLAPKYFYDKTGSMLFERITEQPEYYPTRTEMRILRDHASDIAKVLPAGGCLVEFGSGSSTKIRILLQAARVAAYVPVDISAEFLEQQAADLRRDFPDIAIVPVPGDFTRPFDLPAEVAAMPRAGFFPGSTIGNFDPHEAAEFMRHAGRILGQGAVLVIGVDLEKDTDILNAAYNDAAGVTEAFNLNLLERINRELGANFDLRGFEHHAFYNRERHRIEMHLASLRRQKVRVCGESFDFRPGETIHTENSYKYTIQSFRAFARGSGWRPLAVWTDPDGLFSVHALTFEGDAARLRPVSR